MDTLQLRYEKENVLYENNIHNNIATIIICMALIAFIMLSLYMYLLNFLLFRDVLLILTKCKSLLNLFCYINHKLS